MLLELKVSNFAIIENIHIQFGRGLNILSGETGAGKSVLLKSLALIMGQKGYTESIRTGAEFASIEGSFDISKRKDIHQRLRDLGIEVDEDLLVVKRLLHGEKSRVYLNGSLSTLNTLREVVAPLIELNGGTAPLIEMTGQHENRHLLAKTYHLDVLDQYASNWDLRRQFESLHRDWQNVQKKISELRERVGKDQQHLDYLLFQRDEITNLDLQPGEEIEIETRLKREKHTGQLTQFVEQAEEVLANDEDSALRRIARLTRKAQELSTLDAGLLPFAQQLMQSQQTMEDALYDLRRTYTDLEADPQMRETLEKRLSDIRKLQKKYGTSVNDILQALVKIETEIYEIQNSDQAIADLEKAAAKQHKELLRLGAQMHERRLSHAKKLSHAVNEELLDLNMKGVKFAVACTETELLSTGTSDVEFMTQTSAKDAPKPLTKFASGC